MQILNLVIEINRGAFERKISVVSYSISNDVKCPKSASRCVISDFLKSGTKEANEAINYACNDFNWGDAMSSVPDGFFIKRGLTPLNISAIDMFVNHDEVLLEQD